METLAANFEVQRCRPQNGDASVPGDGPMVSVKRKPFWHPSEYGHRNAHTADRFGRPKSKSPENSLHHTLEYAKRTIRSFMTSGQSFPVRPRFGDLPAFRSRSMYASVKLRIHDRRTLPRCSGDFQPQPCNRSKSTDCFLSVSRRPEISQPV